MRRTLQLGLVAMLAGSTTPAWARPSLPAAAQASLERYDVLGYSDPHKDGIERGKAIGLFDATPNEVYRIASDYARWSEFMPKVKRSEVVSWSGSDCLVSTTAELKLLGESWVEARYHHEALAGETYRIDFQMVRGSMRQYFGRILIEPYVLPSGQLKTTVTYELVAEPNVYAPRGMLNRAIKRTASNSVHALRQRINDLHAAGLLHPNAPPQPTTPVAEQASKARPQAKK